MTGRSPLERATDDDSAVAAGTADGTSPGMQAAGRGGRDRGLRVRRRRRAARVRRPGHRARRPGRPANSDKATLLETLGATVRLGPGSTAELPADADLVITTGWPATRTAAGPGRRPRGPDLERGGAGLAAQPAGPRSCPGSASPAPTARPPPPRCWSRCCRAAGLRTAAVGNIGRPIMETVLDPEPYDVLAVELSSHQLHWSHSLALHSAAVLNLQPDHLQWHGSYAGVRRRQGHHLRRCPGQLRLQRGRPGDRAGWSRRPRWSRGPGPSASPSARPGCRWSAWSTTCWSTGPSSSSAATPPWSWPRSPTSPRRHRTTSPTPWPRPPWPGPTACRRPRSATGCARCGWARTRSRPCSSTAACGGWTTPRPPTRTPPTRPCGPSHSVVWIAGGQAKGTTFDDLVSAHRDRLRGAVLLGVDRMIIADALARHAPEVPIDRHRRHGH